MPALASLEELRSVEGTFRAVKEKFPEAYGELSALFKKYRSVGYKNIVKLMLGETTPEKLKGEA